MTTSIKNKKIVKNPDSLLSKIDLKHRIVWKKIINATDYLNSKYGAGKWSRLWLWEKVNLYLSRDNLEPISLRSFDRYRAKLNLLIVDERKTFTCVSSGLGKNRGSTFMAMTHQDASYLVNIFFNRKKLAVLKTRKLATLRGRKLASHTVYCFNQLNLSSKSSETFQANKSRNRMVQRKTTDSYQKSREGSYAYRKALLYIKSLGLQENDLKPIDRKLWNPITKENAIINLSHFLGEVESKDIRTAFEHFKHEIIYYQRNMVKLKKGNSGYQKALEWVNKSKVKREPKSLLIKGEERIKYSIDNNLYVSHSFPAKMYFAPTGLIDLTDPVEIQNPVLRDLMEKLGKQIEERERGLV